MKRKILSIFCTLSAGTPILAFAFEFFDPLKSGARPDNAAPVTFKFVVNVIIGLINTAIPFLISIAFLLVIWGIFKYVAAGGDNEKIAEGRRVIIWGAFTLFIMLSFWGLVTVVCTSLFGKCPPTL